MIKLKILIQIVYIFINKFSNLLNQERIVQIQRKLEEKLKNFVIREFQLYFEKY